MTTDRSYRKALPPRAAIAELLRNRGTQFDPQRRRRAPRDRDATRWLPSAFREPLVERLGPDHVVAGGRRKLLELQVEHLAEHRGRDRAHLVDRDVARPSSRAIVVNAASSSPQAVIHSVNGAGSRSTFSA